MVQCLKEFGDLFSSSFNSKADHASEASHLFLGDLVILVVLKARVDCVLNILILRQKVSDVVCTSCGLDYSQLQSLESS